MSIFYKGEWCIKCLINKNDIYLTEERGRVGVFQPIPRDFPRAEPEGNPEGWAGKPRLARALLLGITFYFIKHFHTCTPEVCRYGNSCTPRVCRYGNSCTPRVCKVWKFLHTSDVLDDQQSKSHFNWQACFNHYFMLAILTVLLLQGDRIWRRIFNSTSALKRQNLEEQHFHTLHTSGVQVWEFLHTSDCYGENHIKSA